MEADKNTKMDWLYDIIGEFGLFQKLIFLALCFVSFINSPPTVFSVFASAVLPHRCYVPACDNAEPQYSEDFLNFTTPTHDKNKWDRCHIFDSGLGINETCAIDSFDQDSTVDCSHWVYDRSQFISTTVTQYDLVCEENWWIPWITSFYMVGMLMGSFLTGYVSDRWGRVKGLMMALTLFCTGCTGAAFAPNIITYLIMRLLSGYGAVGLFQMSFVLSIEAVGAKWRGFCGIIIEVPFSLGEAASGVVAYFIRDHRLLQLACVAPAFLCFSYYWFMPESIRWLLLKDRTDEALKVTQRAAKMNGLKIPQSLDMQKAQIKKERKIGMDTGTENKEFSILQLIAYPNMRRRTVILFYGWIVCTMVYYGLSMTSGNLTGNIYVNYITTMLIEIPGHIFAYLALDRLGRKGTLICVFFISGLGCIISGVLPLSVGWLILTMNLLGKFGIAAAFSAIFVYTGELYPTEYRAIGVGSCSMLARLGGIISPFIAALADVYLPLPTLIFGCSAIVAGFLICLLPETSGSELPQTLIESENFGTDQSICYCMCWGKEQSSVTDSNSKKQEYS